MEIFGGFMVMMSILGFFLAVLWFILPFVVFAVKGRLDRACEILERVDRRLADLDERLARLEIVSGHLPPQASEPHTPPSESSPPSAVE